MSLDKNDYENDKPVEVAYDDFKYHHKDLWNLINPVLIHYIFSEGWKASVHYRQVMLEDDGK